MKKFHFPVACLVVLGIVGLLAISFGKSVSPPAEAPVETTSVASSSAPPVSESPVAPTLVHEQHGRLETVRPPTTALPAMVVEPLFEPDARVKIGEKAKLRFAARDRASGMPETLENLSAAVFHGNDPPLHVAVEEVDNGVYEVAFAPNGPGLFKVVLSDNGVPVGSQKVGAIGVAGAPAGADPGDPLSEDPRTYRARTAARGRRR